MKAVQINKYGGVEILEVNQNVPKPICGKGQVLVEVAAASINPIDWKVRAGYLKDFVPLTFPSILGGDFAGVIVETNDVTDFKVGDQVFGQAGLLNGGSGSFAQFAAANPSKIAIKPKSLDYLQSAAMPLAGVSALQAVEDHIHLNKHLASAKASAGRQKILIHGGAGGIGHFAIQIAKAHGAYVATTVSARDMQFVKELGADQVIDYKVEAFDDKIDDFDAVFDTVGGETTNKSLKVLKAGGIIVPMAGESDGKLAKKFKVSAIGQQTDGNPKRLRRLALLVDEGKIRVYIDRVFTLDQAKEAFEHLEFGHPRGKVVLKIKG